MRSLSRLILGSVAHHTALTVRKASNQKKWRAKKKPDTKKLLLVSKVKHARKK